ncbi:Eco57I restriction-modification methylase domain-containing protein [Caballeronia sp. LZ035]|uniref:Eco57I restriction-modification methylase domain-containing protein n=1 Tax=Caballeronia sp. LZ035 TaxID=3038568 RepID=UPI00285DC1FA|nr:N-6 DNA methylase [Caballeronia sp. LZ035]MDR5757916.1 N-6 DNA methylase [Caballeronia sp. LZ035]
MPSSHEPLFNQRFLANRVSSQPTPPEHKKILHDWASAIKAGTLRKQKETEVRGPFIQRFFVDILGYRPFGSGGHNWTINDEKRTGNGSADTALGHYDATDKRVFAPVELKGADTPNLDAIMPGRHKSPVMQAWEYAMDTPGCQFLLVSNMVEIRLYAVGHTRQVYERFDILELADSDAAYWKFRQLLGADRFLNGETTKLLKESGLAEKEVTRRLYSDYKTWRVNLLIALMQSTGKPADELLEPVQKLLDRVLFVAFAEDRGLLPPKSLVGAWTHRDPYNPRPVWQNFLGLFRAIDKGNVALGIPAYNGGLFAPDPALDDLPLSDDSCKTFAALGEYDFADDVSVTVLGHIFEQSISDLEQLKELADADELTVSALRLQVRESVRSVSGKRKSDGVVYTPDAISRFIVEETLGSYLNEQQATLRRAYAKSDNESDVWRKPTKAEVSDYTGRKRQAKLKNSERLVEFLFWSAWRDKLQTIRVVDPACGSGAFLVAAFELLDAEYRRVNEQIQAITGNPDLFDINREILNGNLYGVDLNPESIEISKLSLWLKTAQHGKPLESLEANLRVGNSLITDSAFTDRPFQWSDAFPNVFADGGFDVVLGNPPYVRMERLKPVKPYLESHYAVASERADLYCYFYELGLRLLKPKGRIGYISSSTFFKTNAGRPLRQFLLEKSTIRNLIDFSDIQVFEGVTTYPAIVVTDCKVPHVDDPKIRFLALNGTMPESIAATFEQNARLMPQAQLGTDGWQLEEDSSAAIRKKLFDGRRTLKEVYGSPLYGVKTGLNGAFIVSRKTRDAIIAADPRCEVLLKPLIEGTDLKPWRIESRDLWLIYVPKNKINIDDYPAIKAHLLPFREKLEGRATKQAWFELQQAQLAYEEAMKKPKIGYVDMADKPRFSLDRSGSYYANTAYFIPSDDLYLLALLSSKTLWFAAKGLATAYRGGFSRLFSQYVEALPIPDASAAVRKKLADLAESAQNLAEERYMLLQAFLRRMISDLVASTSSKKPSTKLTNWHLLDFKGLQSELKKVFDVTIPFNERDDWQTRFDEDRARIAKINAELATCEKNMNLEVYGLFDLTAAQVSVMESS